MNIKNVEIKTNIWISQDSRLSRDRAMSEAILEQVIISLDNMGKIPKPQIVDNSR